MARWRVRDDAVDDVADSVPAELRDWDLRAWADPAEFRRWIAEHIPDPPTGQRLEYLCRRDGHGERFDFASSGWAVANGFSRDRAPMFPDWERLERVGIRRLRSLDRARRRFIMTTNQGVAE